MPGPSQAGLLDPRRSGLPWLACLSAVIAMLLWAPTAAQALAYAAKPAVTGSTIGRANLNGSLPDESFIAGVKGPQGVAVDAGHVYWTNVFSDTIGRANLNGSSADGSFVTDATEPFGVAVDAGHVYWTNFFSDTIGRANLDGSNADQSFISGAADPEGVAVDAGHVYWSNLFSDTIGRANLDGSSPNESFISGAADPEGVAVDGGHVYWTNSRIGSGGNTIGRANLDGSRPDQRFISGAGEPFGVAVDRGHIYWTNVLGDSIGRAKLDGSRRNQRFISGAGAPYGVAVDGGHVYWANSTAAVPAPVFGRTVNLRLVSGTVLVRTPGSSGFAALGAVTQVPIGSDIDTRQGRVEITAAANARGRLQVGEFYEGTFKVRQIRGGRPLIELKLVERAPSGCGAKTRSAPRARQPANARGRSGSRPKSRHLWGNAKGKWRTRGKGSATTVRGTIWLVEDRCDGTLTRVKRGVVKVRDFARGRTVTVRHGHTYLAPYRR